MINLAACEHSGAYVVHESRAGCPLCLALDDLEETRKRLAERTAECDDLADAVATLEAEKAAAATGARGRSDDES